MRRMLAMLLGGVVVLASPAMAAPSPQVTDAAGDWAVPSQDVLSARLSSLLVNHVPTLQAELTLSQAPATGVLTSYNVGFSIGCQSWMFNYSWNGGATPSVASLQRWDYCAVDAAPKTAPDQTVAATFVLRGATLVWQAPYTGTIKRGARAEYPSAIACNGVLCALVVNAPGAGTREVDAGDLAYGRTPYVIGSDLPRK